jgi:fatty acid desaturase
MAGVPVRPLPEHIEWPTVWIAAAIYAGFGLLTWFYEALPWWLVLPLGGYVVAWHGSLQHEAVHGHPTPWAAVNEAFVLPSLWLWLPFRVYRESHLAHHEADLTDPLGDPESYYVTPDAWSRLGPARRALLWAHNSLAGRLVLGPPLSASRVIVNKARRLARGDLSHGVAWILHLAGCALVLVWVLWVCRVPLVEYLVFFVYPGISLTLLRSFLEHQASPEAPERTVIVESGPVLSLMFLNNNLHVVHHDEPGTAWFRLPARYRKRRRELLAGNGGYLFRGYSKIAARYLLRPKERPVHPLRAAQA